MGITRSKCKSFNSSVVNLVIISILHVVLMYCVAPRERAVWGSTNSQSESYFLNGMDKEIYSTVPPVWDDDIRSTLAQTIGKSVPFKCEVVVKKRSYDDVTDTSSTGIESSAFQQEPKKMKLKEEIKEEN